MPLLWVSLSFLAGIAMNRFLRAPVEAWLIAVLIPIGLAWLLRSTFPKLLKPRIWVVTAACLALFLGAFRYQSALHKSTPADVSWYNDRLYDSLVTGTLTEPPDYRDTYTGLRLNVEQVDTGKHTFAVHGLLLANIPPNQIFHYGDHIRLRGRLETPPADEEFSYQEYLARQGILSYMPGAEATLLPGSGGNPFIAAIYRLKEKSLDAVYRLFPDPEASLLAGILLGVDTGLPGPLERAFKDTGTAHIIAISGFNISIIAGIFMTLFSRFFGPRWGTFLAILGIGFYTFLVGAEAAVVRAAVMGTLSLLAVQVGRRQQGLNTLALVAALMALWNPLILWDAGFQLSFFATLGLILYADPFQTAGKKLIQRFTSVETAQRLSEPLADFVLLTLAAQLATIPIMAFQFKQISLVSFLANPFILPAQPAVMILGGLAVVISLIIYPLGQLAAWIAWPLTAYTIRAVEFFDSIPHGVIFLGSFSFVIVIAAYAVLFTVTFGGGRLRELYDSLREHFRYLTATVVLASLLICMLLAWRAVADTPDGKLHLTFLNVGSADAVFIQTPDGGHILINGGSSLSTLSDALGRRLSPFDRSLDWLIVASTEDYQLAGLPRLLDRYPPKTALWSGKEQASPSSQDVIQWLSDHSVPVIQAEQGQTLDLGKGATLKVLSISSRGMVLLVEWNNFRALLPIGENFDTLDQLERGKTVGPVTVLSTALSGYAPLTPPDWVANLNPRLVVLSVAAGDKNGLPDPATLEALANRSVLRTDQNGWIEVTTDGGQMWTEVEKPSVKLTPVPISTSPSSLTPPPSSTSTPESISTPTPQ